MSAVFADLGMSLDGFIAGPNAGPDNALGDGGGRIHQWQYEVEAWRERQNQAGGEVNRDHEIAEEKFTRAGRLRDGPPHVRRGRNRLPAAPPRRCGTPTATWSAGRGLGGRWLPAPHYRCQVAKLPACPDDEATPMRDRER
jgi:hypothetical protein